jgi:transcriptional regulator of acetoin/glycerol metabolism
MGAVIARDLLLGGPRIKLDDDLAILGLRGIERAVVTEVVRYYAGNIRAASKILGISRSALYAKLVRYGISVGDLRPGFSPISVIAPVAEASS